jgi:glutathione S-transferase
MSQPAILYGDHLWESPYVFSVFVALHEKGVPFEMRLLDLNRGEQRAPEYQSKSLTARVPAIEHEGFFLSESLAILEYLDERFPAPEHPRLLPAALRDRARARELHGWLRSDLMPLRDERPTTTMFYARATTPLSERARAAADKLVRAAELLVPRGEGALFGDFCMADADLAFMLHRLILNADPVPERIARYAARIWQRPSLQAYAAQPRPATPA